MCTFFDYSDVTEITNREAGRWLDYNVRPFYYYWNFFIQSGLWTVLALVSLIYPYLKNRVQNTEVYRFSWLWTIVAVILLSLIPEKTALSFTRFVSASHHNGPLPGIRLCQFQKCTSKRAGSYFSIIH